MGLDATDKGNTTYEPIPADTHAGICISVIDIGTQHIEKWDNWTHKVIIVWELPHVRLEWKDDDGEHDVPRVISREFTMSLSNKAHLRKFLETWRGKPFSVEELAGFNVGALEGAPALLTVLNNTKGDRTYSNVEGISKLPAAMEVPDSEIGTRRFDMDNYENTTDMDKDVREMGIPEWIHKKIQKSREYSNMLANEMGEAPATTKPVEDDDIPF